MIATQTILCPTCRAPNRGDAKFCQQCGNDMLLDNRHGNYRIIKVIKEGGMGTVYEALDTAGTDYAIKEMHDRFATATEREEGIKHFEEEAALLQKLRHPAVPHVYRSFIDEGRYYLAMEFIHGEDLEDRLKRDGLIDEPTVLRWADQLCDVLEYMHSKGLIYRDMKPSNIMITRDGNVKLIDFGIAKLLQPGQRNTMVGTPGYSPPEQYQGLASPKSDIYALAATLHHLLTGRDPRDHPPFSFPLASEINPAISPQTAGALAKALSMDEEHRFQTMDAFRSALPIPTGDRRPTLPFDLPRDTRKPPAQPRSRPQPQPAAVRPQPQPVRAPLPVSPPPQPVTLPRARSLPPSQPARRRGGFGRFVRRVFSTLVLLGVLTGVGEVYRPDIVQPIVQQVVQTVQRLIPASQGTQPSSTNPQPAPAQTFDPQPFTQSISIRVPATFTDAQIRTALRDEYLKQAQNAHPGAQLSSAPPTTVGAYQTKVVGGGIQEVTADMTGTIAVPHQP